MKLLHIVSSLAVASALALSTPVFAQSNMIGDWAIPEDQIATFQEKCRALTAAANESVVSDDVNNEVDATETASVGDEPSTDPDPSAQDNADMIANLTVDQCKEAGL